MDGEFIDPAAFRLRDEGGRLENGLSVNWAEYFQKPTPQETIAPLREMLEAKGRKVTREAKFALINCRTAKAAAAEYVAISIVNDEEEGDPSHALVTGYEAYNDQVAEALAKVIIATYSARF